MLEVRRSQTLLDSKLRSLPWLVNKHDTFTEIEAFSLNFESLSADFENFLTFIQRKDKVQILRFRRKCWQRPAFIKLLQLKHDMTI